MRSRWRPVLIVLAGLGCGAFAAGFVAVVVYVVLTGYPWSSSARFQRDLHQVKPGMTVAEVDALMARYMKGTGIPPPPFPGAASQPATMTQVSDGSTVQIVTGQDGQLAIAGALVYRHSNDPMYNADWGVIHVDKDGKVVKVEFWPD